MWWAPGVRGLHVQLHVALAALKGVAKCQFPPETEADPVQIWNSVGGASETTLYAAQPKVSHQGEVVLREGDAPPLPHTLATSRPQ